MKSYSVENLFDKETYSKFIEFLILNSDFFSFVYFKYNQGEKTKKSVKEIRALLNPYKIFSQNTNEWPGTITLNEGNHIHRFVMYKADINVINVLNRVNQIYEWDYPKYPMDLCFYKNGYAWFESCAHEKMNWLFTDDIKTIMALKQLGIQIVYRKDVIESDLFYIKKEHTGDGSVC